MFNCNKAKLVVTLGKLSWLAVNTKFYKLMFRFVSLPNSAQTDADFASSCIFNFRKQATDQSFHPESNYRPYCPPVFHSLYAMGGASLMDFISLGHLHKR